MKRLRAIDLCSGGGGWACAARDLPIDIIMAVDLWPTACRTYAMNFPDTDVLCADLRDEKVQRQIVKAGKRVDVVLGGIPCEWLSCYRSLVKVGPAELEAQRKTLDAVLALRRQINPRWWCMEDVKELHRELPLLTPWHEINARGYSPQRRKRIFVGDFPLPDSRRSSEMMASRLRLGPYRIGPRAADRTPQTRRTFNGQTSLAAYPDRKSPTILTFCSRRDAEMVVVTPELPGGKRQLEWQEAAALQGFPDDYVFYGNPTDVGKMIGRAVQIDLARAILEAMVRAAAIPRKRQRRQREPLCV